MAAKRRPTITGIGGTHMFKINKKTDYAVRVMVALAKRPPAARGRVLQVFSSKQLKICTTAQRPSGMNLIITIRL